MNRKRVCLALIVLICTCTLLVTGASSLSAKDMVLAKLEHFSFFGEMEQQYYEESSANAHYEINKLEGAMLPVELKMLQDGTFDVQYKFDLPGEQIMVDFDARVSNDQYQGKVILDKNKVILDKQLVSMMQELDNQGELAEMEVPEYVYAEGENIFSGIGGTRESLQQITSLSREAMIFVVEAIPEKYFSTSSGKVVLELDQDGVEEVIYNLLQKVKDEKERVAEFVITAQEMSAQGNYSAAVPTKAEIVGQIEAMQLPSKEQIHSMAQFIQFKELYYAAPLNPGGEKTFRAVAELQPATGYTGQLQVDASAQGPQDDMEGTCSMELDVEGNDGTKLVANLESNFTRQDKTAASDVELQAKLSNSSTGDTAFNIQLTGEETQNFGDVNIQVPDLTPENSMNIEELAGQHEVQPVEPPQGNVAAYVNNRPVMSDVEPFISEDNRMMVPLRSVAEGLNCSVDWEEPNKILIQKNTRQINMYAGEKQYSINGASKQMDTEPVIKEGRTFVPIRFIAEAYDCNVKYQDGEVFIFTR